MKENIKEDIKTVEYNMKCIRNVMNNFEDELCENMQTKTDEVSKIIDNILSDYKRALKENEELREDRDKFKKALGKRITYCNELEKDLFENGSNYVIPKQKVKEKIEELIKEGRHYNANKIEVLQELLESEE